VGFSDRVPKCGPPIGPLAPAICYPHRRPSPQPDAPNLGVTACHICKRTQVDPLYLPENNLIACRKPDSTCWQRELNPRRRVSKPGPLHCGSASTLAHWATEAGKLTAIVKKSCFVFFANFNINYIVICVHNLHYHMLWCNHEHVSLRACPIALMLFLLLAVFCGHALLMLRVNINYLRDLNAPLC